MARITFEEKMAVRQRITRWWNRVEACQRYEQARRFPFYCIVEDESWSNTLLKSGCIANEGASVPGLIVMLLFRRTGGVWSIMLNDNCCPWLARHIEPTFKFPKRHRVVYNASSFSRLDPALFLNTTMVFREPT